MTVPASFAARRAGSADPPDAPARDGRILQLEAEIQRLTAENDRLRRPLAELAGAVVGSVHQRGHEIQLPLQLLEFLTGAAETAALAPPDALARDAFEVVMPRADGERDVAEEIRCTNCGAVATQAGWDGQGWTLARLDLLADRHQCLPRADDRHPVGPRRKGTCTLSGRVRPAKPDPQEPGRGPSDPTTAGADH